MSAHSANPSHSPALPPPSAPPLLRPRARSHDRSWSRLLAWIRRLRRRNARQQPTPQPHPPQPHPSPTTPSPLLLLTPLRFCLHAFLSDLDAIRLLRTSTAVAQALLADFVLRHVFEWDGQPRRQRSLCFAHFERCGVRLNCSCSAGFNSPVVDATPGRSLLPATLHSLVMGRWRQPSPPSGHPATSAVRKGFVAAALDAEACALAGKQECVVPASRAGWEQWSKHYTLLDNAALLSGNINGRFNQSLPPAALPHGLRYLALSDWHSQPLQRLSLPATVTVLHLSRDWKAPLTTAILPPALCVLVFNLQASSFNQPLYPGVLPASLRVLALSEQFNQPLYPGVLPDGLLHLSLGVVFNQPLQTGWAPTSLDTLILSQRYNQPLLPGCLPPVRCLHLGQYNTLPLTPGAIPDGVQLLRLSLLHNPLPPLALPATLRGLHVTFAAVHSAANELSVAVLPAGLQALLVSGSVRLGVMPCGLELLSVEGDDYWQRQHLVLRWWLDAVEGSLPAGLRWLGLPMSCKERISHLVPPDCDVQWRER